MRFKSHDRCVAYNASNHIMVLHSLLKREPIQSTGLSHVLETRETLILKENKARIKNFCSLADFTPLLRIALLC